MILLTIQRWWLESKGMSVDMCLFSITSCCILIGWFVDVGRSSTKAVSGFQDFKMDQHWTSGLTVKSTTSKQKLHPVSITMVNSLKSQCVGHFKELPDVWWWTRVDSRFKQKELVWKESQFGSEMGELEPELGHSSCLKTCLLNLPGVLNAPTQQLVQRKRSVQTVKLCHVEGGRLSSWNVNVIILRHTDKPNQHLLVSVLFFSVKLSE